MISYQIYSFNKDSGSASVLFKRNEQVIAAYNIDIPLNDDGLFISGEELDTYLLGMFPQHVVTRQNKLEAGIPNAAEIESLVVPLAENESTAPSTEEDANRQMWQSLQEEKRIAAILVKFGVLATDPTEIPTATL